MAPQQADGVISSSRGTRPSEPLFSRSRNNQLALPVGELTIPGWFDHFFLLT